MKREIKFRVWNGQKMEMNIMAGFLGAFYVQGIDENDTACMSPYNTKYPEPSNVMQFTGLLDKNGIEIYEGDILKGGLYLKYEVQWDDNGWNIASYAMKDFEVIGHIYENQKPLVEHDKLKPESGFNVISVWEDLDCVDPEDDEHTVIANFNTIDEAIILAKEKHTPIGGTYIVASDGKRYNRNGREGM